MKFFNYISINLRLFINTLLSIGFMSAIAYIGWQSLSDVQTKADALSALQKEQTSRIANLQQSLILTTQLSNEYILTRSQASNQKFNQAIDELKVQTEQMLKVLTSKKNQESIQTIENVLRQYKKVTNSNVFLKNEINNTLEYGITPTAETLENVLKTLADTPEIQDSETLFQAVKNLQKRLADSQLMLGKLISTKDTSLNTLFDQQGLGDIADTDLTVLNDELGSNFAWMDTLSDLNDARDGFQESFGDIKDYLNTETENNNSLIALINQANQQINFLSTESQQTTSGLIQELNQLSHEQIYRLGVLSLVGLILILLLNLLVVTSITGPLHRMKKTIARIAQSGELAQWKTLKGKNELVDMSNSINDLIGSFRHITGELQQVGTALSHGQFNRHVEKEYAGDLLSLKENFNDSVSQISHTMTSIQNMSEAIQQGNLTFSESADQYQGAYHKVVESLNDAMATQRQAIESVKDVMLMMNKGDFSKRIELDMPGDLAQLKTYLNNSLDKLDEAITQKSHTLDHFRQGNFAFEIQGEFEGKLKELKNNMQDMAANISDMLADVQNASSDAVNGVQEISLGNQDLNQRVNQQAQAIQNTMNHMQQMINQVNESLSNASTVNNRSSQAKENTLSGVNIVNSMVEAISEIEAASEEIASFTQVIDDIAFQTNLLALNAAVEAARAGEQGRGFAVVATEVRNLASKSGEAAHSIQDVTQKSLKKVKQGIELSELTKKAFEENAQAIDEISSMMAAMHDSLNHQSHGIEQVNHSLLEINEITQQNASLVEEVTHTSTSIIDSVKGVEERLLNFQLKASDSVTSLPPANEVDENEAFAEEAATDEDSLQDEGTKDETLLADKTA
ncbi:hypothetical protein AVO42_08955 [Thiomicrospira sp. XS5]|uniref:methyl-accepting chemotaxis protein n=1 Tax=Thiomicrospira sp. XS5 TaxID=1775636 RepID=UPI00074A6724|nr:methyl-accepting chemotaxis protein [Thiomicrospira sp. XS5]KUJ75441.1 hypothetical protein AVO42_08955 [Thiomicrospira sp. XS5]